MVLILSGLGGPGGASSGALASVKRYEVAEARAMVEGWKSQFREMAVHTSLSLCGQGEREVAGHALNHVLERLNTPIEVRLEVGLKLSQMAIRLQIEAGQRTGHPLTDRHLEIAPMLQAKLALQACAFQEVAKRHGFDSSPTGITQCQLALTLTGSMLLEDTQHSRAFHNQRGELSPLQQAGRLGHSIRAGGIATSIVVALAHRQAAVEPSERENIFHDFNLLNQVIEDFLLSNPQGVV